MKSPSRLALFVILVFVACSPMLVFGQGTDLGTIRGTVTDSSGAVVPGASVSALDVGTGAARGTKTNSHGEYQIFGVRSGAYKVTISNAGMSTAEVTGLVVNGSDVVSADAVLKVATSTEQVTVTSEAPIINTSDQTISTTITNREVIDLPRDSRDVYDFLYLNPNITQADSSGELKFLGFQSYGASFTLDGQRSTNTIFGSHSTSQPSLEAVSEVNVLSNDFSAEYAGIGNVRITTKRGENQFHGSAFYNNKNSALAALQIQDQQGMREFVPTQFASKYPTPYFNFNDVGASLGGPIPGLKKTWFFMAYERNVVRQPVNFSTSKLPHPAFWTGDFSPLISDPDPNNQNPGLLPDVPAGVTLTPAEIATDTYQGLGQQFVTIPSRLLNPYTQKLIDVYFPKVSPSVAVDTSTGTTRDSFQTLLPGGSTRDLGTLRIDHDFSDRDHVYGVYNAQASVGSSTPVFSPMTGLGLRQNDLRDNTLSFSYVRMIHNNLINEARGGFNREFNFIHSNTTLQGFLSSIGFDQNAIDAYAAVVGPSQLPTHGHPLIELGSNFVTFGRNGDRFTERQRNQYLATFGDTLTWVVNNHNLKMGADFVRNVADDGFAASRGNPRGRIRYQGGGLDPFTNFLLGLPARRVVYVPLARPIMQVHNWEQGYFFQDDWKVTPRLTLNLGVRYEQISPFVDKNDIMFNFDPNFNNHAGRFIAASDKTLQFLDPRIADTGIPVVTAAQSGLGVGRGLLRTDKNNVAPRIGMALRVGDKSVVRGGYGIYFPTSAAQGIRDPLSTNAFNQTQTKQNITTPLQGWPTPLSGGDAVADTIYTSALSFNAVPVDLHSPLIQQYNATYERELGLKTSVRFSYLGVTSHGLIGGTDLNELAPSNTPWGTTQDADGDGIGDSANLPCTPDDGDCAPTLADYARLPYPTLGDYLISFGNYGHSQSNSYQAQVERRFSGGLMFNASYTYADQKSTGLDLANSSLGGVPYNSFNPELDYTQDSWVSHHRFVFYGIYDLPVGRGKRFGSGLSGWADAVIGGWETSFQMFAKTGTAFTPYWSCDNCFNSIRYASPGNIAAGSIDAVGDFTGGYRPLIVGDYKQHSGDQLFNPAAFAPPPMGADIFTNPAVARKNLLWGPGAWGVNFGLHKDFKVGERVTASLGADFDNIFNHPIRMPDLDFADGSFAYLGGFNIAVDPNTRMPTLAGVTPNDDPVFGFGRASSTFSQEGIDSRRTVRLRLRITF